MYLLTIGFKQLKKFNGRALRRLIALIYKPTETK